MNYAAYQIIHKAIAMGKYKRVSLILPAFSAVLMFCLPNIQPAHSKQETSTQIECVVWSPDGTQFAAGRNDGTVKIWDTTTNHEIGTFHVAGESDLSLVVYDVKWSPDGSKLAAAASSSWSYALVPVLDSNTGQILASFSVFTESHEVDWSPDGSKLAAAAIIGHGGASSSLGVIKVWDTTTWQESATLDQDSAISSVAWSPDGTRLASGDADGVTIIRDVTDWQWLYYLLAQSTASASDITWSPDGTLLAVTSGRGPIRVWSTSNQQILETFDCSNTEFLMDMSWSQDGTKIAAACSEGIRIWDVSSGSLICSIPTASSRAVAWSPDSSKLLYATTNSVEANTVNLCASATPAGDHSNSNDCYCN